MNEAMKNVLIFHRIPVIRHGLQDILAGHVGSSIAVKTLDAALSYVATSSIGAVLCEANEIYIAEIAKEAKVIAVVLEGSPAHGLRALSAGAVGCISIYTESEAIVQVVKTILVGSAALDPQEMLAALVRHKVEALEIFVGLSAMEIVTIAHLSSSGGSNRAIADAMNASEETVRACLFRAMKKTHTSNRVQLCLWAIEKGLDAYAR